MFEVKANKEGTVTITGSMTIRETDVLYQELSKHFNKGACRVLDCSNVTEIDTAGLQVLIAFKLSTKNGNTGISVVLSDKVEEALQLTGLSKMLKGA